MITAILHEHSVDSVVNQLPQLVACVRQHFRIAA
jgi:hypothetical protein